uniref:Uncharacterized protein n=1 Tax=Megaselia scalaris TaxID=36166 RepID=T1GY42_MEGSC
MSSSTSQIRFIMSVQKLKKIGTMLG